MEEKIRQIIQASLDEDIGAGDITTKATVDGQKQGNAQALAKGDYVIAGIDIFAETFSLLDNRIQILKYFADGQRTKKGDIIARVQGSLSFILQAERVALNIFQRMCGIATRTAQYVEAVKGTKARILDTRKTAPGLRILDKIAVKVGGGMNHRMGLYDAVLIKDNHIAAAGGITSAVKAQRNSLQHSLKIEVETKSLLEVEEALSCGVDIIMLDNMTVDDMKKAVTLIASRAVTEASGNVSLENVAKIAAAGVDYISVGELTHSVRAADISLNILS